MSNTHERVGPEEYLMAEGRAMGLKSRRWHYVRAYGRTQQEAMLALVEDATRKEWEVDGHSVRYSPSRKGV